MATKLLCNKVLVQCPRLIFYKNRVRIDMMKVIDSESAYIQSEIEFYSIEMFKFLKGADGNLLRPRSGHIIIN